MDSGLYAVYTGLLARTQALELNANNLANAGTTGFRAERQSFGSVLAQATDEATSQVGTATNNYGVLGSSRLSLTQGVMNTTGNPLDCAIQGDGFFAVQTPGGVRYTRDGSFTRSDKGQLQTAAGNAVLNAAGKPITLPSGVIGVGANGSISVSDASGSAVVDRLGVYHLGATAQAAEGAGLYSAGAQAATVLPAATVRSGALEGANQDAVAGTVQLLQTGREAEMMQRALSVFHNDFDKTAAEELPRVNG